MIGIMFLCFISDHNTRIIVVVGYQKYAETWYIETAKLVRKQKLSNRFSLEDTLRTVEEPCAQATNFKKNVFL